MNNLTLYGIMGQDTVLWAELKQQHGQDWVHVTVRDYKDDAILYQEKSHINGWNSLVDFARQVLACDKRLKNE